MSWSIWEEKLLIAKDIKQLDDKEVFTQQMELDWPLPGLCQEAIVICKTIGLKDVCTQEVEKEEILEAMFYH